MGINHEEKLTSSQWAPPAVLDESLVKSAWWNDGKTTWILETFISWDAFADGNADITGGMNVYLEACARDDDDDGVDSDPYEAMLQWSADRYAQDDGIGLGTVTLSNTEIQPVTPVELTEIQSDAQIFPNPVADVAELRLKLGKGGSVYCSVFDISGKLIDRQTYSNRPTGLNSIALNTGSLVKGIYLLSVQTPSDSKMLRFIKE